MNVNVYINGLDQGLFPLEEVQRRYDTMEFPPDACVRPEGESELQPIANYCGFRQTGISETAPLNPSIARPGKAVSRWKAVLGLLLILGVAVTSLLVWMVRPLYMALLGGSGSGGPTRPSAQIAFQIPTKSTSGTEADTIRRNRAFLRRQWLGGYEERGTRNPSLDIQTLQFIRGWVGPDQDAPPDPGQAEDLRKMGDKLVGQERWNDPLAMTVAAHTSIEMHEKARRLEKAVLGYEESRHHSYPKLNATVWLATTLYNQPGRVKQLDSKALVFLQRAFTDGSVIPQDQPILADILVAGWGEQFFFRNREAITKIANGAGNSYEWLYLILAGQQELLDAWDARGDGYADSVSPKGWKEFAAHLNEAKNYLTQAWQLRPDLPLAAVLMEQVALGQSEPEEIRLWFTRAVALQIDHKMAWDRMRWSLRPRWGGSKEEMLALGISALETKRFDTNAPWQFFATVADLESEEETPAGEHIYGRGTVWPHLQTMYEGYIAEPKRASERVGWRSTYAVVAFLAGKLEIARSQLEQVNWEPRAGYQNGWGRDLSLMVQEVEARTGPDAQKVGRAESLRIRGAVAEALEIYSELEKSTSGKAPRTRQFIQSRMASLTIEKRLSEGQWVDLLPKHRADPNLRILRGNVPAISPEGLDVHATSEGHMVLSQARIGADFEARGTFDFVQSSNGDTQAGIVFGLPNPSTSNWFAFRLKSNTKEGQIASYSRGWAKPDIHTPVVLNPKTNQFSIRLQSALLSADVNGRELFHEVKAPSHFRADGTSFLIGLGAFNDMNETRIRYRTLQVRRLSKATKQGNTPESPKPAND